MILIDSSAFVALLQPSDALHERAAHDLNRLAGRAFVTITPVLSEVCFLLPEVCRRQRLVDLLRQLDVQPCSVTNTADLWNATFAWLKKYADHAPDWCDGHLAVLAGQNRKLKIWTYDRDFATIWRTPDGGRIPLAVRMRS